MNKFVLILLFLSSGCLAGPGHIVKGAEVTTVTSSSNNDDIFRVYYQGGTNDQCSGGVRFFKSKSGSEDTFNKAFSLATTGLVSGMKISIYSHTEKTDCDSAITVELSK